MTRAMLSIPMLTAAAFLAASCDRPAGRVEEPVEGGWRAVALQLDAVEGRRDGYRTTATVHFSGPGGGQLQMQLVVVVDPQPSLESGTWSYDGPTGPAGGTVTPEHILFAGGQGEGVSLGGSYVLQAEGVTRYRVRLRPQAIERGGWKASALLGGAPGR